MANGHVISASAEDSAGVGGDFYDFPQLGSGDWTGALADVSGKGMSAALLSSFRAGPKEMTSPS
jgi:serine phosphatase RsbU (regulator of sigma subunit)